MLREFETIQVFNMLSEAYEKMNQSGFPLLPVLQHDELVGILTPRSIGELVLIGSSLKYAASRSAQEAPFAPQHMSSKRMNR